MLVPTNPDLAYWTGLAEHVGKPVGCYDCAEAYGTWPDLRVPDAVWKLIAPTSHGDGLLCPNCIYKRCAALGLKDVPCTFASGPLRSVEYVEGTGMAFLNDLWPAGGCES